MSKHLPECECYGRNHGKCALCICDRLRACEQRAEAGAYNAGYVDGSKDAREGAFYEAREAVERVSSLLQPLGPALAAIDALREEQK